jgi:hypothetical protein
LTSAFKRLIFQQYELRAVRRRVSGLELPAGKKENGRTMPKRGTENSPVPILGTPPLPALPTSAFAAVLAHSGHALTRYDTIKKIPRGKTCRQSSALKPLPAFTAALFTFCSPLFTFVYHKKISRRVSGRLGISNARRQTQKSHAIQSIRSKPSAVQTVPFCSTLFRQYFFRSEARKCCISHTSHTSHTFKNAKTPAKRCFSTLSTLYFHGAIFEALAISSTLRALTC